MDIPPQISSNDQPQPNNFQSPPEPPKSKSTTGIIIAVVAAAGLCLCAIPVAVLLPVFTQAKKAAVSTEALSQIKTSATSVMVYLSDHDDRFPPSMGENRALTQDLLPYLDNPQAMVIMNTPISSNPNLAAIEFTELEFPESTIMLFCAPQAIPDTAVVAAADSSSRKVKPDDLLLSISNNSYKVPPK